MTAHAILADLRARGIAVRVEGDHLKLRPKAALTDADYARLRAAKADLLRLLRPTPRPPAPIRPLVREPDVAPHAHRPPPPTSACATCGGRRFWMSAALTGWICEGCHAPVSVPAWRAEAAIEPPPDIKAATGGDDGE